MHKLLDFCITNYLELAFTLFNISKSILLILYFKGVTKDLTVLTGHVSVAYDESSLATFESLKNHVHERII
jgi:hypothetical protein